ncbi:alpha/beta hydrolase [Aestuariivirga sp.]|uniref:alpha/beta hydrolase n=1 Tax=Aestuariivirga sp. TaxID=2650926 RepID=UPI0039E54624
MGRIAFDEDLKGFRLAYMKDGAADDIGPCGFFWLGGYKSEMTGTKAENLADLARATRRNFFRFDYSGHGQSDGLFIDGTISDWLEQATHMFLRHTQNPRIIVGSSMGGWLALLLTRRLLKEDPLAARRIAGLVLIAPATDMTKELMWDEFDRDARTALVETGVFRRPSAYGEPYPITLRLLEDGTQHLLLEEGISLPVPVRILQGSADTDVPPAHAVKTFEAITATDLTLSFIKDGDHRLSTAVQLRIIQETVLQLALRADGVRY